MPKKETIDYAANAHKLGTLCGDDASKWAAAFCQIRAKHGFPADESNMLGWFANAIEIAHDTRVECVPNSSEVLMSFLAWLTSREEAVTLSSGHDSSFAVELFKAFELSQGLPTIRDQYTDLIKPYPANM